MTSAIRPADEAANLITHALGLLASLVAVGNLMSQVVNQPAAVVAACGVYSVTLLLMYGCSTLSHLFYDVPLRRRFRTLDQSCIFLLIAGSYTPFAATSLSAGRWTWLLVAMWSLAGLGVARVLWVRDLSALDKTFYGVMGFLPVIALPDLAQRVPFVIIFWIIAGGAAYSLGAPFLCLSARVRYAHAVWHLCVIAGSACHYWAILLAVTESRS